MADSIDMINQGCVCNETNTMRRPPVDVIEIFSTFANNWSMENQGCGGTLFLLPHDASQSGLEVSSDFTAVYDLPTEQVQTISHSSFSFQNTGNEFKDQNILVNTTTPLSESWELTESVCPGGNDFFTITTPAVLKIPGIPSPDVIQICDHAKLTHSHTYTWDINQTIQLLPRSTTKVTFQTTLKHITRKFQFVFWMTGNIGITSMNPINGKTETYFPITQVLQWYQNDLLTLDLEFNKVTCLNKGIYTAIYQVDPQLLIQTQSLDNPSIMQETILNLDTGNFTPVNTSNGCC